MKPASLTGSLLVFFLVTAEGPGPPRDVALGNNCQTFLKPGIIETTCRGHGLQDVPSDIVQHTQILDLSSNNLTYLAKQLWVSGCETRDNGSCSRFPNLIHLNLSSNLLVNMSSSSFFGMKQLEKVYLGNNLLTTIPHDLFLDNSKLEAIDLSRNSLTSLYRDTFNGLHGLRTLQLQNNYITVLHSHIFSDLENLRLLRLERNRLRSFPDNLLSNLTHLQYLYASGNQLAFISPKTFLNIEQLHVVDLSHNHIQTLSRYVFQQLVKFSFVNLSSNCLSSVYLSHLPVSVNFSQDAFLLTVENGLCTGLYYGSPCFLRDDKTGLVSGRNMSHMLDFSYNNISKIEFSKVKESHTLEYVFISFAGNRHLSIPVSFVKQERFIITVNMDGTNLSWRNLTLFNELFELQHLTNVSIAGCEACEYYTLQVLYLIFNPHLRVLVTCQINYNDDDYDNVSTGSAVPSCWDSVNKGGDGYEKEISGINLTMYHNHPCDYTDNVTVLDQALRWMDISFHCFSLMDCSYLSLPHVPEMRQLVNCLLLSHNNIQDIEPHYFDSSLELEVLDLSFNNLHHLPENVFDGLKNIVILIINNNYLTSLKSNVFRHLSKLKTLLLDRNQISSYSPDVFGELGLLMTLAVNFSNLTKFHEETLQKLTMLERLLLRHETDISKPYNALRDTHFKNLISLKWLTITGFQFISSSKSKFFPSKFIQDIGMKNCVIQDILIELITPFDLVELLLPANKIQNSIPRYVFRNSTNLRSLDLSQNEIKFLVSDVFSEARSLIFLNISYNKLNCIPLTLFDSLIVLEKLDISYNPIISLDYTVFSKLFSIQKLYMRDTTLEAVSNSNLKIFSHCENTEVNYMSEMTFLPEQNVTNKGPSNSNTMRNNLVLIKENAFGNSLQLKLLNLVSSKIDVIDEGAFANNVNLTYLFLNNNHLTSIKKRTFHNLVSLNILYLQRNRLQFVENGAFQDLRSLIFIHLGFNSLTSFNSRVLPGGNNFHHLLLNDNLITLDKLNMTLNAESLTILNLHSNPLGMKIPLVSTLGHLSSLRVLDLGNTSLTEISADLLNLFTEIVSLDLDGNPIGGLSSTHFFNSHNLVVLNLTRPVTTDSSEDTGVTWRNMTLINYWFEMPELHIVILVGNPICDEPQWTQIILNLFLSDTWKVVACPQEYVRPAYHISSSGKTFIFGDP